jgi:hypothetical protein
VARKRISMDQGMTRRSSLDLSQSNKITAFKIPVAVFEFPERRVRRSGVEDIANCHRRY